MDKINSQGEAASFQDLSAAANTITKAREGVLGKAPDTVINNTNAMQANITHTPAQLKEINEALENAC